MSLRPYQVEARDSVHASWNEHRSVLLVMATGTGKTYTAGEILRERATHGRILWLAHRGELLTQAMGTIENRIGLGCDIEKAQSRAPVFGLWGSPVVVASVQTLRSKRLQRWPTDTFATIVVDEAHHAAAKGYREILKHFGKAKVLGLTATPDRGDGVALGHVFDHVAMQYDIRTAIKDGYLCQITQKQIQCADLDISDVKTVAGDLAQGELEKRLRLDAVLHQIAAPLVREAGERPTIVFTAGVAQAHALVDVLASYAPVGAAVAIDGTTPPELRAGHLEAFSAGKVQYLINCAVLTEGFDAPITACIAMARPTKSRALYAQCIGRGTRLAPGKTDCLVLDFVGNSGRHRLVNPLDVLGGGDLPEDVAKRAQELCSEGQPSEAALAQAEAEAIEKAKRDEERRRREAKVRAEVAYRARKVDPFGVIANGSGPRATKGQIDYLAKLKVELKGHVPSRREASKLIDTIKGRQKAGLCTYKQAKLLASKGLNPDLSFQAARNAIDALAANRWQPNAEILAQYGTEVAA